MNDPRFGSRMTGEGEYAEAIHRLFETTRRRLGLARDGKMEEKAVAPEPLARNGPVRFRTRSAGGENSAGPEGSAQLRLFGDPPPSPLEREREKS
jgi:hypothetical protein